MSYGSEDICILGEEFGANSPLRGTGYHDFKAYRGNELIDHTWTSSPGTYSAECAAYQARLDRGSLTHVEVQRRLESGPFDKKGEGAAKFKMYARQRTVKRGT